MDLSAVNFAGVITAFFVNFIVGFIWFGPKTFFPIWWKAIDRTGDPGVYADMKVVFSSTAVAGLVSATGLSLIFDLLARTGREIGPALGLGTGLTVGIMVMAAPALSHRLFAGNGFKVWLLEIGSDVLGFALMGVALSYFY
ncbi:MAG: hypothetical protein RIR66_375 [Actinomycetota bacterium]